MPPIIHQAISQCSPSLAIMKYWGKAHTANNTPATPSIAVTLKSLMTETRVFVLDGIDAQDMVVLGGVLQTTERYASFFAALRSLCGPSKVFWAESANNFPTAAGLASSSSGFAALVHGACAALGIIKDSKAITEAMSQVARVGSASAARSLYGGFTLLDRQAYHATELHPANHWPELRVIVVRIHDGPKEISSRKAMEQTRITSPFYQAWVDDALQLVPQAQEALANKNLPRLGELARKSYLRMFSTMFAADPPIIYWQAQSLTVMKLCTTLRQLGIEAWETMDAGPQVKIFCLAQQTNAILQALATQLPDCPCLVDEVGDGPCVTTVPRLLASVHPVLANAAKTYGVVLG